jgi:hypothetical protein
MIPTMGVLQRILEAIQQSLAAGAVNLFPIVMGYVILFGMFALALTAYGILRNGHALHIGLGLLVRLALVAMMLDRWPWFLGGLRDIAVTLGIIATGDHLALADFLDPGMLLKRGLDSGALLWSAFAANMGWTSFVTGLAYLAAYIAYVGAFCTMAYKVFWWQVELLLAGLGGLVLLPTLIFRPMAFVAQGVLSYAANAFARFLIGSILAGALWDHLGILASIAMPGITATTDMLIQAAFVAAGTAWILASCFLSANRLAGVLTSGIPGMAGGSSMGAFLRGMAAGATGLATVTATATTMMVGVARGVAAGGQGLIGAAGAAWQGTGGHYRLGEVARHLYAGTQAGMQGGLQAQLGRTMQMASTLATRSGQQTIQHLQGASWRARDETHGGTHAR